MTRVPFFAAIPVPLLTPFFASILTTFLTTVLTTFLAATVGVSTTHAQESPSEAAARVHMEGAYGEDIRFIGGAGGDVQHFPGGRGGGNAADRLDAPGGNGGVDRYERGQGFEAGEDRNSGSFLPNLSMAFGQGAQIVFVILFCIAIVILIVLLARQYGRPNETVVPPADKPRPVVKGAPAALPWNAGDPDLLAAEGRYREAIVALLVQAMKLVGWREDERSQTAREVLMHMMLEDPSRAPMNVIVGRSELVRFAGATADLELFIAIKERVAEVVLLQRQGTTPSREPAS